MTKKKGEKRSYKILNHKHTNYVCDFHDKRKSMLTLRHEIHVGRWRKLLENWKIVQVKRVNFCGTKTKIIFFFFISPFLKFKLIHFSTPFKLLISQRISMSFFSFFIIPKDSSMCHNVIRFPFLFREKKEESHMLVHAVSMEIYDMFLTSILNCAACEHFFIACYTTCSYKNEDVKH